MSKATQDKKRKKAQEQNEKTRLDIDNKHGPGMGNLFVRNQHDPKFKLMITWYGEVIALWLQSHINEAFNTIRSYRPDFIGDLHFWEEGKKEDQLREVEAHDDNNSSAGGGGGYYEKELTYPETKRIFHIEIYYGD